VYVALISTLAATLFCTCIIGALFIAAWRRRRQLEEHWPTIDPGYAEKAFSPNGGMRGPFPAGDPFYRAQPVSSFSLSVWTPDVKLSAEQQRSMSSYYRPRHNESWMSYGAIFK
jgi:hypothetical protein